MSNNLRVGIIGGGGGGMMAAISAAKNGAEVTLLEKTSDLGQKVIISGRGRCNVTNKEVSWKNYNGTYPKFTASVFSQFSNLDVIEFFENRGVELKEEDRGRMFPVSNKSKDIVDALDKEMKKLKVKVFFNTAITSIEKKDEVFEVVSRDNKKFVFDKLIIATGGKTYPKTGSTGDGYEFAKKFGHNIIKLRPVSVPFRIKSEICNKLMGIKVDCELKLVSDGKLLHKDKGHILFTHLGISGPVVLRSSRVVSKIFAEDPNTPVHCVINMFPNHTPEQIQAELWDVIQKNPTRLLSNLMHGILPKKVPPTIFDYLNIKHEREIGKMGKKELNKIIEIYRNFDLGRLNLLDWDSAQFTAGGVDVKEIDSKTMESKLVPGLHFCGEVVDIDGQSGGFNLTWAWCSGWVAGL